jgi:hypothetical protein
VAARVKVGLALALVATLVLLAPSPVDATDVRVKKPCAAKEGKERERCSTTQEEEAAQTLDESRRTVDQVIDTWARGVRTLTNLSGTSMTDVFAQYQRAESDFEKAARLVSTSSPSNLPTSISGAVASALTSQADALAAVRSCYSHLPVTSNPFTACSSTLEIARRRLRTAASALPKLVPHGTRDSATVVALFQ